MTTLQNCHALEELRQECYKFTLQDTQFKPNQLFIEKNSFSVDPKARDLYPSHAPCPRCIPARADEEYLPGCGSMLSYRNDSQATEIRLHVIHELALLLLHLTLDSRGCRWGTCEDVSSTFLHLSLSSTILWNSAKLRPVHSFTLSSHLFLCLPHLRPPLTVPCRIILQGLLNGKRARTILIFASSQQSGGHRGVL